MKFKTITLGLLTTGLLLTGCSRDADKTEPVPPTQLDDTTSEELDDTTGAVDTSTTTPGATTDSTTTTTGAGSPTSPTGDTTTGVGGTAGGIGTGSTTSTTTGVEGSAGVGTSGTAVEDVVTLDRTEIQRAQNELMGQGYLDRVTGTMDDATIAAIESFQRSRNLPVTGQFNKRTLDALGVSFEADETESFGE